MHCDDQGLHLNKAEITALLEFTPTNDDSTEMAGVQFRVDNDGVWAYATNMASAVKAAGSQDRHDPGEWQVHRDFLDSVKRVLGAKETACFRFEPGKIRWVRIVRHDEPGDEGVEVSRLQPSDDVVKSQLSLPDLHAGLRSWIAARKGRSVGVLAVQACFLASIDKVAKAAGKNSAAVHMPTSAKQRAIVQIKGATLWTVAIMPVESVDLELEVRSSPERSAAE